MRAEEVLTTLHPLASATGGFIFWLVMVPLAILLTYLFRPERHAQRALMRRSRLDDQAFYDRFYGGTNIPEDIPIRLRRIYAEQFGQEWIKVYPQDDVGEAYPDLDLAELLCEVEDEFGVSFPEEVGRELSGTFDSIVQYLAEQRRAPY
jgi:acyl carrier protein